MNYEFDALRPLVHALGRNYEELGTKAKAETATRIKKEVESSKMKIHEGFYQHRSTESIANYFGLLNCEVNSFDTFIKALPKRVPALDRVIIELNECLLGEFIGHFNPDLPMSSIYSNYCIGKVAIEADRIKRLIENSAIDQVLADVVLNYITQNRYKIITYRQLAYYIRFITEIHNSCSRKARKIGQDLLIKLLIALNFNNRQFIQYYQDSFVDAFDKDWDYTLSEKDARKKANLIQTIDEFDGFKFDASGTSAKQALLDGIAIRRKSYVEKEELEYAELKKQMERFKPIDTNMSVPQICLMVILLYISDIFNKCRSIDIIRWIHYNVRSKKQKTISIKSLENHFDKLVLDETSLDTMESFILKIFKQIRKKLRADKKKPTDSFQDLK